MKKENKYNIRLFVDFDGTATEKDVGYHIFNTFLPDDFMKDNWHEKTLDLWRRGIISSKECLTLECSYSVWEEKKFQNELETIKLMPGFYETAMLCRNSEIPLMILSDGLDYYIKYILKKHGLDWVEFRSNGFDFVNGTHLLTFPHADKGCGRCGNCKRWHIENSRQDGELLVYAGDGYSDRWAVRSVDMIFARGDLADYCNREGLKYFPFENFFDIHSFLSSKTSVVLG